MSVFSRLLGRQAPEPAGPTPEQAAAAPGLVIASPEQRTRVQVSVREKDHGFIRIPEIGFFGPFAKSPSGSYIVAWRDRGHVQEDGTTRLVPGRYVLLRGDELLVDASIERPQDGKVADDGTFVLNDWGDVGELSGTFHAFDDAGRPLLSRQFEANLHNNGLSPGGDLAVCQTCNAPGSPDSSLLTIFDVRRRREIACWSPEPGWASHYAFPGDGVVELGYRDLGQYAFSLDGVFLDRGRWLEDGVGVGDRYVLQIALAGRHDGREVSDEALRRGLALARRNAFDDRDRATVERMVGELEDPMGAPMEALAAFDRALALNPKVGVRRRAEALRRELAGG